LPLIAGYLEATRVSAFDTVTGQPRPLVAWPDLGRRTTIDGQVENDLRTASRTRQPVFGESWAFVPVPRPSGDPLVVMVERKMPAVRERLRFEFGISRVVVQLDVLITRLQMIQQLEELTRTDGLTELPNRRSLSERLDYERMAARRRGEPLT